MNTRTDPDMEASMQGPARHPQGLAQDESGAVMVLGIFMCTCLVGVLWYLAGVGEAVIFRERMQEAADAVAFSTAVLQARGMNLIVLINLVMACVLGVRVALKVVQLALVICGAIFAAIGWFVPIVAPLAGPCFNGAGQVQSLLNSLKNPIDNTLKALSKAQQGIGTAVPAASILGGSAIGHKYEPAIESGLDNSVAMMAELDALRGLPIEEGSGERLCFEAGRAFGSLLDWAIPDSIPSGLTRGVAGEEFSNVVGKIVSRGGAYFCENGSGGSAPNLDDVLDDTANRDCDAEQDKVRTELNDANRAWTEKCTEYGVVCTVQDPVLGTPAQMGDTSRVNPPERRAELNQLKATRDQKQDAYDQFDWGRCKNETMNDLRRRVQENGGTPSGGGGTSENMTPKKTTAEFKNGVPLAQVMGFVSGNMRFVRMAPKGVKVGAMRSQTKEIEDPFAAEYAVAQAEFFYDCRGRWERNQCNGEHREDNEDAMWHFKWRARLRRYNSPSNQVSSLVDGVVTLARADMTAIAASGVSFTSPSPGNLALKADLTRFLNFTDTTTVLIH